MTLKKKFYVSIFTVLGIIIIAIAALLITWNVISISYDTSEKIELLDSQITITRGENGIPTIEASTRGDMYFALGYIHARDRLDLIEKNRALATGNSSDFINNKEESRLFDTLAGTIGFTRRAEEIFTKLSPEQKKSIERYCAGINHIRKDRPSSFLLPRDWSPRDVIAILVMKEWTNSYLNNLELVINMPDEKKNIPGRVIPGDQYIHYYSAEQAVFLKTLRSIKDLIIKYSGTFNRGLSVYVDSTLDASGENYYSTFTYYDYYSTYPGWYPVKILMNNTTIDSITFSGLPFMFAFKNSEITMLHFNINADTQDFIIVDTAEKSNRTQYRLNNTWRDFKTERTPVAAADGSINNEIVWITDKGPVLNNPGSNNQSLDRILVLNSVFPGAGYVMMLLDTPFTGNLADIKKYITGTDASLKCFMVINGNNTLKGYSGYISSSPDKNVFKNGSVFIRSDFTGYNWFKNGMAADYAGSDVLAPGDLVSYRNSIITEPLKNEQLNRMLVLKRVYSEEKIIEIINDNHSEAARKFIPVFRAIIESNPLTSAKMTKIYFNDWDYNVLKTSQAASIFYTTLNYYIRETLKDEFGDDLSYNMTNAHLLYNDFFNMLTMKEQLLYDNPETENLENREMVFDISFFNAMRFLNRKTGPLMDEWVLGRTNTAMFTLPRLKYNVLSYLFKPEPIAVDGGPDTLSGVVTDTEYRPVSGVSISGYMNSNVFKFSMNTGYSTSLLSDFFYGKTVRIPFTEIGSINPMYKTVLSKK
ncbi:MAG TPA: penicillin acylase family protein [Spirochaetota bacterium]|nr:penicillin acylase family protein [Spirochaetota bacterium]